MELALILIGLGLTALLLPGIGPGAHDRRPVRVLSQIEEDHRTGQR